MSTLVKVRETIADLYREKGKAELINGEIVRFMSTGIKPSRASSNIYLSLRLHEGRNSQGLAAPDNAGFVVNLPRRESFSPDAAWYVGEIPEDEMNFFPAAPVFAAEVRSKGDYGRAAEREMSDKRRDYFAAGTLIVWDVDLLSDEVIKSYRHDAPDTPVIFRRGDVAEAEPAVPGWRMAVDELFR